MPTTGNIPDFKAMRDTRRQAFLTDYGWHEAQATTFPQNSFGRTGLQVYSRLEKDGKSIILIEADPAFLEKLTNQAQTLSAAGLRVPEIHARDEQRDFALLEDFGENRLNDLDRAMDTLITFQQQVKATPLVEWRDDMDYYTRGNRTFADWVLPAKLGHETPPDIDAEYHSVWKKLLSALPAAEKTLGLTDYKADDLFILDNQIGVLADQEIILAHPIYNVVTLLENNLPPEQVTALQKRYREARTDLEDFDHVYAVLRLQRHMAALGNAMRLAIEKKEGIETLDMLCKNVAAALDAHPSLEMMRKWMTRHCPDYHEAPKGIRPFLQ